MKRMRKVLALVVALTFLFSVIAPVGGAFAATPSAAEKEGNRLLQLDVIKGYTDGTLGLDKQITRAEICVILAKASGMGNAADMLASSPSKFKDVKSGEWYTGWINLASSQGWVKGDPQGTFRPNDNVSYREIVTMLMKILGYNDNLAGTWPANYLGKAASLGITKSMNFDSKLAANRGDVFILTSRTLDKEVVQYDNQKNDFVVKDGKPTLLEDKFDCVKVKDVVVTSVKRVNGDLKDSELKLTDSRGNEKKYTLLVGQPLDYFGLKVDAWINNDDEIVGIKVKTADSDVVYDTIDKVSGNKVDLVVKDDTYDVASDAVIWVNNSGDMKAYNRADGLAKLAGNYAYGRVVLNDSGDISFIYAYNFEDNYAGLVTSASKDKVEFKKGDSDKKLIYTNFDNVYAYDAKLNPIDVSSIQKDSLIYTWENNDDDLYMVVAGSNVSGKLEKAYGAAVTIAGTKYDVSIKANTATVSSNADADIKNYDNTIDEVKDIVGSNVTAIVDLNGDVRHIRGDVKSTSGKLYGVVSDADRTSVTIWNSEGKEVTYTCEKRADADPYYNFYNASANVDNYIPVQYELTKDGKIKDGSLKYVVDPYSSLTGATLVNDPAAPAGGTASPLSKLVLDKGDYIKWNSKNYFIGDKTVILQFNKGKDDDVKVVKWADIEDKTNEDASFAIVGEASKEAKFVVFYDKFDNISSDDTYYAIVTDKPAYNGDDYELKLAFAKNDDHQDGWYALDDSANRSTAAKGYIVKVKLNSSGKIKSFTAADVVSVTSNVYSKVTKVDGNTLTLTGVNGGVSGDVRIDKGAVVWSLDSDGFLDKAKSYNDIVEKDKLIVVQDADGIIKAAIIITKDTTTVR